MVSKFAPKSPCSITSSTNKNLEFLQLVNMTPITVHIANAQLKSQGSVECAELSRFKLPPSSGFHEYQTAAITTKVVRLSFAHILEGQLFVQFNTTYRIYRHNSDTQQPLINNASTVASQELSHLSNTTATSGLTSKFGMGLGRALTLWPACIIWNWSLLLIICVDFFGQTIQVFHALKMITISDLVHF